MKISSILEQIVSSKLHSLLVILFVLFNWGGAVNASTDNDQLYGGIGIQFQNKPIGNNYFRISDVLRGGPADKAGIQNDDLIAAINNHTEYSTSDEVAALLRGLVGSNVQLTIKRKESSLFSVNVTRELIKELSWLMHWANLGDTSYYKNGEIKGIKNHQTEIAFFDKDSGFNFPGKIADFSYTDKMEYGPKELGYSLRYRGEQQELIEVIVYNSGFEGIQNGTDGPLILKSHMRSYDGVQHLVRNGIYISFLDIKGINKFPSDFLNNNFSYIDTRIGTGKYRGYMFSRGQNKYFVKVRASTLESNKNPTMFEDKLNKFLKQLLLVLNKEYEG
ncbi:MAG TPA: PDZ domain-containing protein [Flavobacteriales bacterium]|nr:PDZ domain-containing protein [Flavobacteriales bacterium]